jgi:hypothetical protein
MLVVFGSDDDAESRAIVAQWAPWGAVLCTPDDLSTAGWRHSVGAPEAGIAVAGGRAVPVAEITGVLTRLQSIRPDMLGHIDTADRDYVASEMTAFLIAFISTLRCKVLNPPSAGALSGPGWRQEQWIQAAARAGIPVCTRHRHVRRGTSAGPELAADVETVVIGDCVFGLANAQLADWARSLSRATGAAMLGLGFKRQANGFALAAVDVSPTLNAPEKLDAAREYLSGGRYP